MIKNQLYAVLGKLDLDLSSSIYCLTNCIFQVEAWYDNLCNSETILLPVQAARRQEDQVEQEFRPWCHPSSRATSFVLPTTWHNSTYLFQTLVVFHSAVFCHWSYPRSVATTGSFRLARTYYFLVLFSMCAIQPNLSWLLKRRSLCSVLALRWRFRKFCRCWLFSWLDAEQ